MWLSVGQAMHCTCLHVDRMVKVRGTTQASGTAAPITLSYGTVLTAVGPGCAWPQVRGSSSSMNQKKSFKLVLRDSNNAKDEVRPLTSRASVHMNADGRRLPNQMAVRAFQCAHCALHDWRAALACECGARGDW